MQRVCIGCAETVQRMCRGCAASVKRVCSECILIMCIIVIEVSTIDIVISSRCIIYYVCATYYLHVSVLVLVC